MIGDQDLQTYVELGQALWADPEKSRQITIDTLAATSLLDLPPERVLERAAIGLLKRADHAGMAANTQSNLSVIGNPFFRLFPEERFILTALHLGHWSYTRLAGILGDNCENIERLAWKARLQLASGLASIGTAGFSVYPAGAGTGMRCPPYEADRPWTQRFLDDEIRSGSDRLFLQNHMMACRTCYQALSRCRDLYYQVDAAIARSVSESTAPERGGPEHRSHKVTVVELRRICQRTHALKNPIRTPWVRAMAKVLSQRDVQFMILALVVFWGISILKKQ